MPNMGYEWPSTAKASRTPTARDLEWAAGFLEGEGAFVRAGRHSQQVRADQIEYEPLLRLRHLFGGRIYFNKKGRGWRGTWAWYVCGSRARGVMLTLYLLLGLRRQEQIRNALSLS